jgi:hypothetical protein
MNMENEPNQPPDSELPANKMGAFTAIGAGVGAAIGVARVIWLPASPLVSLSAPPLAQP